ncbi:hypothetical protein BDZ89DRAFT_1141474 [Hymenopellis radicata]|nr:hypothetical protein BDZ89DRAFT_1141474 [Hymenopellis radicata]
MLFNKEMYDEIPDLVDAPASDDDDNDDSQTGFAHAEMFKKCPVPIRMGDINMSLLGTDGNFWVKKFGDLERGEPLTISERINVSVTVASSYDGTCQWQSHKKKNGEEVKGVSSTLNFQVIQAKRKAKL